MHCGNFVDMLVLNLKDYSVNDVMYSGTGTIVDGVFLRITVQIHLDNLSVLPSTGMISLNY